MKQRENFRVVASVNEREPYRKLTEREKEHKAKILKEQIVRHCDADDVHIEWDTVCSNCGRSWEEDSNTKEPVCCNKAQAEFAADKQKTALV